MNSRCERSCSMPSMARSFSDDSHWRRNSKLETFLKRNLERDVYEKIRAYEPCVVLSETLNKVFMHVVLSDKCIYLTEYPPRTLQQAVDFTHILDIELINDLPDFLSGREREQSLHIRIVHTCANASGKCPRTRGSPLSKPGTVTSPAQQYNYGVSPSSDKMSSVLLSTHSASSDGSGWRGSPLSTRDDNDGGRGVRKSRSTSCPPNPAGLGLSLPLTLPQLSSGPNLGSLLKVTAAQPRPPASICRNSPLTRLMKRAAREREKEKEGDEKKEAELHLYAVSLNSQIYLHLQSSWNSYIMKSTQMLDPLYIRTCNMLSSPSPKNQRQHKLSWERTSHLFRQLSGELLQDEIGLESLYLLLQELFTAAQRNPAIKKLFWRSPELYPFLVKTLTESSQLSQDRLHTVDRLLLCTLVVRTLSLMFRETEIEPARLLTSKQGAVSAAMLLALVFDPELQLPDQIPNGQPSLYTELLAEYLDAASVLLFEIVVFCHYASRIQNPGHFLTVGWVFRILKSHPFLPQFMGYQAQQIVWALSDSESPLSPSRAVLLYQRCHVLLTCLQYSTNLSTYIITEFREEFRYYVRLSGLEDKLPPHYPISEPARRLLSQLLRLVLH